jgi:AcrR family transcriptional regulator
MTNVAPTKRDQIIDAAIAAFLRHGPKHISMADIAEVAGMSRPALYQIFKNKQALFRAVVEHVLENMRRGVEAALKGKGSLAVRLGNAMVAREGVFFRLLHASPHAKALDEAHIAGAADITEQAEVEYRSMLSANMIKDGVSTKTAAYVAGLLSATAHGLKRNAKDPDDFDQALKDAASFMARRAL